MCPDVLGGSQCLIVGDRLHSLLTKAVDGRRILPQIKLRADQDNGDVGRMMTDLWVPLLLRVSLVMTSCIFGDPIEKTRTSPSGDKDVRTLALTLSNDGGLTMEKQIRKTSV